MSMKSSEIKEILAPESITMGVWMLLIMPWVTRSSSNELMGVGKVSVGEVSEVWSGCEMLTSIFLTGRMFVLGTGVGRG